MTIPELRNEIDSLRRQIQPLTAQLDRYTRKLADAESVAFIEVNGITKANIQMSEGDGIPYFGTCWAFGDWLKSNSKKRWAEWNTIIYHSHDLIMHEMRETAGRTEHLS